MLEEVLKTITKYKLIESGDRIVLGVSGGPDSICMLSVLNELKEKLNFEIFVAHINHGIRENAKIDEEYVLNFCRKLNIECFVLHAKVKEYAKENKMGLEEAGRKVRYDFFNEILQKTGSNKIAIAHNSNDNVETIILNVLRGSGPSGLKGILPKNGVYIRPLIEIKREDIEEYTKEFEPRHDESNDENEFSRNKVRNIVIPFIKKEFNPNIIDTVSRLSEIVSEESEYLSLETERIYNEIKVEEDFALKNLDVAKTPVPVVEKDLDVAKTPVPVVEKNLDVAKTPVPVVEKNLDVAKTPVPVVEKDLDVAKTPVPVVETPVPVVGKKLECCQNPRPCGCCQNPRPCGWVVLDLKKFNVLNVVLKRRIILYSINKIFGTTRGIEKVHIDDIIKMCGKAEGNKYLTPNKNTKVLIKNNKIVIFPLL